MRIATKLRLISIAGVVTVGAIAVVGAIKVQDNVNEIIKVDSEKMETAVELEINLKEASAALFGYLSEPHQALRTKYREDVNEFLSVLEKKGEVANTDEERADYQSINEAFQVFDDNGERLFLLKDLQQDRIAEGRDIHNNRVEPLLDDDLQQFIDPMDPEYLEKLWTLQEIEINNHELLSAVRGYILKTDDLLRARVDDSLGDLMLWRDRYAALGLNENERASLEILTEHLNALATIGFEIMQIEDEKTDRVRTVNTLIEDLDAILDDRIQTNAQAQISDARQDTLEVILILKIIIALSIGVLVILVFFATRPMVDNFRTMSTAIAEMRERSREAPTVEINSRDEFGEMAAAFNGMSRAIEDQTRMIRDSNAELERQIKARDEAMSMMKQADESNTAKSEFLATISHELRTPLNAILGFSDMIRGSYFGPVNEKYTDYANDIHSSGTHLLSLVDDLLDLSRIDAGKHDLEIQDADIREVISDCVKLMQQRVSESGINLKATMARDLKPTSFDPRAIKQIIINLVSNSAKFTPNGGTITIDARRAGGSTIVSVSDTGVGIAESDLDAMTEVFAQANRDPYHAKEGWGLGLAISKSLIELHGGELSITSELGTGTTVTFSLPDHR